MRKVSFFLCFVILLSLSLPLLSTPSTITAQSPSPTPIAAPITPEPTLTPSIIPTPIPTLSAPLSDRAVITADNAHQIGQFRTWQAYDTGVIDLAFMPDNGYLISSGSAMNQSEAVRLWTIEDEKVMNAEDVFEDFYESSWTTSNIRFSPDGQYMLAVGSAVKIWDVKQGILIGSIIQSDARRAAFIDNSTIIVKGSNAAGNGVLSVWQIAPPLSPLSEMPPPENYVYNPQGVLMTAMQIKMPAIDLVYDPEISQGFVLDLNAIPYTYTYPDFSSLSPLPETETTSPESTCQGGLIALDIVNQRLAYTGCLPDVVVYDYLNQQELTRYRMDNNASCLTYSPDGNLLVIGEWAVESELHVIDTNAWETVALVNTGQRVSHCAISPDNTLIATGSLDGEIALWGVS